MKLNMQAKCFFFTLIVLLSFLPLGFTQVSLPRPIVRLIYFLPNDRQPQPDIDEKLDRLLKGVQQLYANQMEAHGFGRKTFLLETDAQGKAVVHHFVGQFTDAHYSGLSSTWDVWEEIDKRFDTSKNIYVTVIDMSSELLNTGGVRCEGCDGIGGIGGRSGQVGGKALFTVFTSAEPNVTTHELAHAFGLHHDTIERKDNRIFRFNADTMLSSFCAAEWLDMHRAFNSGNRPLNQNTTIKLLTPSLSSPPNAIRLRFAVTDPDGIHQAQLLTEAQLWDDDILLRYCEQLKGNISNTIEFVTRLTLKDKSVYLNVMDVHGNITWREFPIEIAPLLSSPEIVSIPDKNLASAVREEIGNSITTRTMLNLTRLNVSGRQIIDLTGLEHAHNLSVLDLSGNAVSDFSPLVGLRRLGLELNDSSISDVSPLAELTQLRFLGLNNNSISDVSPLAELTQLSSLDLDDNSISDISPLAELTQLINLWLNNNSISDASPLTGLTQLTVLGLNNNSISDASPLAELTQLDVLELSDNSISDVSPLAGLTRLRFLGLDNDSILDASPLAGLTRLRFLKLYGNSISDVSPLAGLTQLTELWLGNNSISDVSPLAGLTQLTVLGLYDNAVGDVSPLLSLNLTGITGPLPWGVSHGTVTGGIGLFLEGNPLNYASIHTHIPAMQAKGIEVGFDNIPRPALLKISGDAQEGASGTALTTPFIVEVRDERGKPMKDMSVMFAVTAGGGRLSTTTTITNAAGRAQTLLTLGQAPGTNTVRATVTGIASFAIFNVTAREDPTRIAADVNGDGIVNVLDLVVVAVSMRQDIPKKNDPADVNEDGVVNIIDLVTVAGALGGDVAAPAAYSQALKMLMAADVQQWLTQAQRVNLTDVTSRRGVLFLEYLLAVLTPKETLLLPNYPNPFNPETWIPYHLAKSCNMQITIYDTRGRIVRRLDLGHQREGYYTTRSHAAYWDGRNEFGEPVASGVYFYTLTADEFTATRKMLILK